MSTLNVLSRTGQKLARTVELPASVFDVEPNHALLHQVVVAQLAAARAGTHKTKTRGEVRGGGAKPYRQKGTGRARQGSIRAPQYVGGGVVHGPVPRDYRQRTPKKMKAAALRGALSDRARGGRVHVLESFVDGSPSTKAAVTVLRAVTSSRRALVVVQRTDDLTWRSLRNAAEVHLLDPGQLNTYDVLVSDDVVFTEDALTQFLSGPAAGASAAAAGPDTAPDLAPRRVTGAVASQESTTPTTGTTPDAGSTGATTTEDQRGADTVSETPATEVGTTSAAGEGVSDEEMAAEVEQATSRDLEAEPVFEAQAEGAETDTEIAKAPAEDVAAEVDPR